MVSSSCLCRRTNLGEAGCPKRLRTQYFDPLSNPFGPFAHNRYFLLQFLILFFLLLNSNEQVPHLLRGGTRQVLGHFQGQKKTQTRVRGHQAYGQGEKTKDLEWGSRPWRTASPQYHPVLRTHGNQESHVGSYWVLPRWRLAETNLTR